MVDLRVLLGRRLGHTISTREQTVEVIETPVLGVDDDDMLNSVEAAPCFPYRSAHTAGEKDTHDDKQKAHKRTVRPVGSSWLITVAGLMHRILQGFAAVSVISDLLAPIDDRAIEEFFKQYTCSTTNWAPNHIFYDVLPSSTAQDGQVPRHTVSYRSQAS